MDTTNATTMTAADVMTQNPITVRRTASILDAIRLMLEQRISGLPVVDEEGGLVGVLTEGDLLRRAEIGTERRTSKWLSILSGPNRQAEDYVRTHGRRVEEVMTTAVASVTEDAPLETIASMMEKKRIKRVPVVNGRRLVGIVSRADLMRVLAKALAELPRVNPSDAALREQIDAELQRHAWAGRSNVSVVVTDGIVDLEGCIYSPRDRDALRVVAENVPGVKEVHDHLDYFDPSAVMIYGM
jgi:CBS domain-containing protein